MVLNENKTKTMIFNYTNNYQFSTSLKINEKNIDVINSTRLLGTIIQKDLRWDLNTRHLVKKANARMEILRRVSSFGAPVQDLKEIYILFIRSLLEQSATVWHSSLTQENAEDLERVQKIALRIILKDKYQTYKKALAKIGLDKLSDRREKLCLIFAQKCKKNPKTSHMFPEKKKLHTMNTRNQEKYEVQPALSDRLRNSPIIYMQNLLNKN